MSDLARKYNEFSLPVVEDNSVKIHDLISKGKETLKSLTVYVAGEEYDKKMSFEQNLAEDKIKLLSALPVSNFSTNKDPIQECMSSVQMHQDFNNYLHNNNQNQGISDFDALVKSDHQTNSTVKTEPLDHDSLSDTSQDGEKLHICDVCDKKFNRRRDLALHYITHSENERRNISKRCDICKSTLKSCKCKKMVKKQRLANPLIETDCISLPRPLNSNTVFIRAVSVSGKSDIIKRELFHCAECSQVFGLDSQMKQHALAHKRAKARREKELKALTCEFCNTKFNSKSELLYHKSTLHANNTELVSNQISEFQSLVFNNMQPQVCTSCQTIFNDLNGLQKHFKRLGWVCGFCSTYFCLKSDFSAHYITHLGGITYDKITANSSTENLLPKNEKVNKLCICSCRKCPKKFKSRWMLNQHKLKHNSKKYRCLRCKKSFKQKVNSYIHFFSHGNNKKYECGECDKSFYEEKCLQYHMLKAH